MENEISEITRRAILDELILSLGWMNLFGRYDEVGFLGRIFNLEELPSTDGRFKNAHGDIWQHRVNNSDWPEDWWITDPRISALHAPDEVFLKLASELVHPLVRPDATDQQKIVAIVNRHLRVDGWEIAEVAVISGRSIYGSRRLALSEILALATAKLVIDAEYIRKQITRMEGAVLTDPELAIGTAKEFLETVCRTILSERGIALSADDDMPALVKAAVDAVPTVPEGLKGDEGTKRTIRIFVNNLSSMGRSVAELRNSYGTGHGKDASHKGLEARHVRLIVNAATAVGVFLFESHIA